MSYPANVLLVVIALFPGLINTSAIPVIADAIAGDLHGSPILAYATPLMSDAALAFGCILAAELSRRADGRLLFHIYIAISLLASLACATTHSFPVFVAAHVVHGLVSGMLFVSALPPLLVNFDHTRLPLAAMVLVPSLFGAATLGPVVGSFVDGPGAWRDLFTAEVVTAFSTNVFAFLVLRKRPAPVPHPKVDWYANTLSAVATALIFIGVLNLARYSWASPHAWVPVVLAGVAYAGLLAGSALMRDPLVPVRELAGSLALAGAVATVVGSACFAATQTCLELSLGRISGEGVRSTGLALLPEFGAAIVAGYVFSRLLTTKWVILVGLFGLALSGIAAALTLSFAPVGIVAASIIGVIAAFGAGLTVTPGLFLVTLSFPGPLVARGIALLNLSRLTFGFIAGPGVEHQVGTSALSHYTAVHQMNAADATAAIRTFIAGRHYDGSIPLSQLRDALASGISQALGYSVIIVILGMVAMEAVFRIAGVRLIPPNLEAFDRGEPALESPPLESAHARS
jgi:MFS family permease